MSTNIVMLIGPERYRLTRQALETLRQHTDPSSYTLTLVCDTLDFRTGSLVAQFLKGDHLATALHVENSGHTLSQLKNIGVAWSEQRFGRGDWLYLSDSDVAFTAGWLEKLANLADFIELCGYKLWGGQVHPFHQPRSRGTQLLDTWAEHQILDGPSWLMRWSTWDKYGPFDRTTAPGVCQSEEYPFCQRLLADGGRIDVISPHVVIHTGLTHLDGHDAPGRKEREAMIPKGILAL